MSYDKNGRVGIGKVAEFGKPGSLDVLGDIYSNNKPIQQYQLTNAYGGLSRGSAQWDDIWVSRELSLVGEMESTQITLLATIGDYFKTIGLTVGKACNFSQG